MCNGPQQLKRWMKAAGITQLVMAERLGINRFRMHHIISGKYQPNLLEAFRIQWITRGKVKAEHFVDKSDVRVQR